MTNISSSSSNGMDCVALLIDEKLKPPQTPPQFDIFKVPYYLRGDNETVYEPEVVSIGPYHRGKTHLKPMEDHKLYYLSLLLQRRGELSVDRYAKGLRELEKKVRGCYEVDSVSHFGENDFVEMLLLDGIFILEVMRRKSYVVMDEDGKYLVDPVFQRGYLNRLRRDLLLVENQIPFFVLLKLHEMTAAEFVDEVVFMDMAYTFLSPVLHSTGLRENLPTEKIQHLVSYMHTQWLSPDDPKMALAVNQTVNYNTLPGVADMESAGIKFKKLYGGTLFDISFEGRVIKMPTLIIDEMTESIFRNFIVYEQVSNQTLKIPNHVMDYAIFLSCLIKSPKDVELLCRSGIIVNMMGDNEMLMGLVYRLNYNASVVIGRSIYRDVYERVNKHCHRRFNGWVANLRRDYFKSPWALISLLAAIFLLALSIIQSVCSVYTCQK